MKKAAIKPKEYYDPEEDIKWIVLRAGEEAGYYELTPGYNLEFDSNGEYIGIEIFDYTKRLLKDFKLVSAPNIIEIPLSTGANSFQYDFFSRSQTV